MAPTERGEAHAGAGCNRKGRCEGGGEEGWSGEEPGGRRRKVRAINITSRAGSQAAKSRQGPRSCEFRAHAYVRRLLAINTECLELSRRTAFMALQWLITWLIFSILAVSLPRASDFRLWSAHLNHEAKYHVAYAIFSTMIASKDTAPNFGPSEAWFAGLTRAWHSQTYSASRHGGGEIHSGHAKS